MQSPETYFMDTVVTGKHVLHGKGRANCMGAIPYQATPPHRQRLVLSELGRGHLTPKVSAVCMASESHASGSQMARPVRPRRRTVTPGSTILLRIGEAGCGRRCVPAEQTPDGRHRRSRAVPCPVFRKDLTRAPRTWWNSSPASQSKRAGPARRRDVSIEMRQRDYFKLGSQGRVFGDRQVENFVTERSRRRKEWVIPILRAASFFLSRRFRIFPDRSSWAAPVVLCR